MPSGRSKIIAALVWLCLIGLGFAWGKLNGFGPTEIILLIYRYMENHPFGAVIYIVLYALRPIILFPAMLLTITAGSLFGFWAGWLLTIIGENLSANTAYAIGRFLGEDTVDDSTNRFVRRWRPTLDEHAVATVVILRVLYLPFDLVNYGCGFLAVPWVKYAVGTFIGILPPMVTFVSFGASIDVEDFLLEGGGFSTLAALFNGEQLLISGALFVGSLVLARLVHLHHRRRVNRG